MNIDYTVTALMFPAIPLLMSVYSNRFHTLSKLIRELHDEHVYEKHIPPEWKKQFINLSSRISILRWTIMFASFVIFFYNKNLKPLDSFVLPGGHELSARIHICRVVCRRTERFVVRLSNTEEVDPIVLSFLNRFSDFLFVAGRWVNNFFMLSIIFSSKDLTMCGDVLD